jgi:hypothetical protein
MNPNGIDVNTPSSILDPFVNHTTPCLTWIFIVNYG